MRAERRLGECIRALKETVGLNEVGRPKKTGSSLKPASAPTLSDAGVDKKLSSRAQKRAAVPEAQSENRVAD